MLTLSFLSYLKFFLGVIIEDTVLKIHEILKLEIKVVISVSLNDHINTF